MRIKNKRLLILTGLALLGIGVTSCNANEVPTITTASASTTQAGPDTTVLPNTTTVAPTTTTPTTSSGNNTGEIETQGVIKVTKSSGYLESVYVEWEGVENVENGQFGADMKISALLDGPVTILLDTDIWSKH